MTEHNCRGDRTVDDPVGLAAYTMDSHNTQRWVKDGYASNEGDVQVGGFAPYGISYQSIVPKQAECGNLFVPVCLAASHIAYGSIRMEPVFMVLGQSSATAAAMAIDAGGDVQQVDYAKLRERLLADNQVLEWTGPRPHRGVATSSLPGTVVDDDQAELIGEWTEGKTVGPFVGRGYRHDANEQKSNKAVFTVKVPSAGRYEVRISYSPQANRATNVPVTITAADGEHRYTVNQRKPAEIDGFFHKLEMLSFEPGQPARVTIETAGTDGHVIVDAVQLLPVK
jgi:hypothetical protein